MPSSFSWLDYSDRERRRVLDVARSLGERDTRDELGVATVRDALADLLAPGVSTIQTRVRYFLFVPWLYLDLEAKLRRRSGHVTKEWVARQARDAETSLITHLKETGESGVIGSSAGKRLQRLPSSVYWNGLREWGIRLSPLPIDAYHHHLAVAGPPRPSSDEAAQGTMPHWHAGLPQPPEGFPTGATMQLRPEEAAYLRDRIVLKHSGSLLGQLVLADPAATEVDWPWDVLDAGISLPADVANTLRHAREFSLCMHGAVLIYNLMLAEKTPARRDDWVEKYRTMLTNWADEVSGHGDAIVAWNREDFWQTVRRTRPQIHEGTQNFIEAWLNQLLGAMANPLALADDSAARNLIDNREHKIKKAQARLHNARLLETWNGDSGAGLARMGFRWAQASQHLAEIHDGLSRPKETAVA